jgi:hypothetical protein
MSQFLVEDRSNSPLRVHDDNEDKNPKTEHDEIKYGLDPDYIQFDFELVVSSLNFTMENEFGDKLIELRLV